MQVWRRNLAPRTAYLACATLVSILTAACASGPDRHALSNAVARIQHFECPAEQIRVLETKRIATDQVYLLDACGVRVEVEHGMALPSNPSELTEMPEQDIQLLAATFEKRVPFEVLETMRSKVQEFCVLGAPGPQASAVVRYNSSAEELATCQQAFARALIPLGADRDERTHRTRYWFRAGQWVFSSFPSYRTPRCERLVLQDSKEMCACRNPGAAADVCRAQARAHKQRVEDLALRSDDWVATRPEPVPDAYPRLFLRFPLSIGRISATHNDNEHATTGALGFVAMPGVTLFPGLALGISGAVQRGFGGGRISAYGCNALGCGEVTRDVEAAFASVGPFTSLYPSPTLGLHFDSWIGMGVLRTTERAYPLKDRSFSGFSWGGGMGYEFLGEQLGAGLGVRFDRLSTGDHGYRAWVLSFLFDVLWVYRPVCGISACREPEAVPQ